MAIPTVTYNIAVTQLAASWQVYGRILSVSGLPDKGLFVFRRDPFSLVYNYSHVAAYDDLLTITYNQTNDDWNRLDKVTMIKDTQTGADELKDTMETYIQLLIDEKRKIDYEALI